MAVALQDLVPTLKAMISSPGADNFPDATNTTWVEYLVSAFWEIRMLDMLSQWTESGGEILPVAVLDDDIPRELQQLIVLYAAIFAVTAMMAHVETKFRAKGGPAEFEVQRSAQVLQAVLEELQRRRALVEQHLFDLGAVSDTYIDSVIARDDSQRLGISWWVS